MKLVQAAYTYSPTTLVRFWENEFCSWLDHYAAVFPDALPKNAITDEDELLFRKGQKHEKTIIEQLQQDSLRVFDLSGENDPEATIEALKSGHHRIYQASFHKTPFQGIADLLIRVETPSNLGCFSYEVVDIKFSKQANPTHLIQLCCYAEMLEAIQGFRPKNIHILLGNQEQVSFRTGDYYFYYLQLKEVFLAFHREFNTDEMPEITNWNEDFGRWTSYVDTLLEEKDHLCRVANITKSQVKKLIQAGIRTLNQLADSEVERVPKLDPLVYQRLRTQAKLQQQSQKEGKPIYEFIPLSKERSEQRIGLANLPPPSPLDVFFDMEGNPHYEDGLEYLFGAVVLESGQSVFKDWWAFNHEQEKQAFEAFIDWVYARWQKDPTMHIYHYASYEVTAMRKLMGQYGTREKEVDDLLRNEVFVDLYRIVSQSLRVGEPSYSIKKLERFYREARTTDLQSGGASIVYFEQWLEFPDGDSWENSELLKEIRDYNQDDCVSTYQLTEWLRGIQQEVGISYIAPSVETSEQPEVPQTEAALLAEVMLNEIPQDRSEDPEKWRLQELFSWLLEFYRREQKPYWWQYFTWLSLTDEELIDDYECLGLLTRTRTLPTEEKQSLLFEYQYDPHQETKLREGDACKFLHQNQACGSVSIFSLDRGKGRVQIKVSQKTLAKMDRKEMPYQISLIPGKIMSYASLERSIYETVKNWHETGVLKSALKAFLLRERPTLTASDSSLIIPEETTILEGAVKAALAMQDTTLCIQGPPGTGKTYTAAHMILALMKAGHRVGITSNSHKAIVNLMEKTADLAQTQAVHFAGLRIGPPDERLNGFSNIVQAQSLNKMDVMSFKLIGATAWPLSEESMANQLDYLFIDEAGQVSLANLVATSRSTRNIVIMGDQMQLDQPIQGSHPGESGLSILEYYLQDKATIPEDLGIFLETTWRLHPDICAFISESVYEGRLISREEKTRKQRILLPNSPSRWVNQEAGILFVPVEHEGSLQSCEEEVTVIQEIVKELLGRVYENDKGEQTPLTLEDILFVTPYNLQVRHLKDALGERAQVASVDKFQGQEAPVVIVSMCSSDGNESIRGLDFLLSKNRLNVALSRAKSLAIVVGSPKLGLTKPAKVEHIPLINLYCRLMQAYNFKTLE